MRKEIHTKEDWYQLFFQLNEPLKPYYTKEASRIDYATNGVAYGNQIAGMEGFSRVMWGAGPAIDRLDSEWLETIVKGIINGTNPEHAGYWGEISDRDQRMVEMPALALSFLYHDQLLWNKFSIVEQRRIAQWLNQILEHECADGNWQFFKVIVATVLKKLSFEIDEEELQAALTRIEDCYLEKGWYRDSSRGRQDYYNPYAFHYYGLVYSLLEPDEPRSQVYRERARQFSLDYWHFYDEQGNHLPFGRSMTYRFAVTSFWCALVKAEVYPFELGVIKGIIHRSLNWWLEKPIVNEQGILSLGYTYSQLSLTEPYNSSLSPYWLNKIFILLDLPAAHEFWQVEEEPMPTRGTKLLDQINMLAVHDNGHTFMLNAGQTGPNFHVLTNEKYLKFAYSTKFGFSIPRANQLKEEQSMDSMLGVQRQDVLVNTSVHRETKQIVGQFLVRNNISEIQLTDTYLASTWIPMQGTAIRTWLATLEGWQIRVHRVETDTPIALYETGFALANPPEHLGELCETQQSQWIQGESGLSGIIDLTSENYQRKIAGTMCFPNTNVLTWENTYLPGLEIKVNEGTYYLGTAVYAHPDLEYARSKWQMPPRLTLEGKTVQVTLGQESLAIPLI